MSTPAQIAANQANAQASTGPRTSEGKAASSKNGVTFGLFCGDFIRPGEESEYKDLYRGLVRELEPEGVLQTALVDEIRRATWRLRRCGIVESRLAETLHGEEGWLRDSMEDEGAVGRIQKSVDRARSQAHRILHKCTAELRRLQADRRNPAPAVPTPVTQRTQSEPPGTPRNAPCHCG